MPRLRVIIGGFVLPANLLGTTFTPSPLISKYSDGSMFELIPTSSENDAIS